MTGNDLSKTEEALEYGGVDFNRTGELLKRVLEENRQLKGLMKEQKRINAETRMAADLKAIRKIDPAIKSFEDLGDEFFELVRNGIDGVTAFMALKAKGDSAKRKAPPSVGKVARTSGAERDYFTARELNMLSARELDDPKVLKKALRSMVKSKK